jgi:hypothetical protein
MLPPTKIVDPLRVVIPLPVVTLKVPPTVRLLERVYVTVLPPVKDTLFQLIPLVFKVAAAPTINVELVVTTVPAV